MEVEQLGVEHIVFGGDIVGYGPRPAECVDRVRECGGLCVIGNHDFYTLLLRDPGHKFPSAEEGAGNPVWAGVYHALHQLDEEALDWLAALPHMIGIPGATLSHAALHDPGGWPYLQSAEEAFPTLEILANSGEGIGFFGHTHRQESFQLPGKPVLEALSAEHFRVPPGGVCAVVVGSVGQPRTRDNRAAWVLWDSGSRIFEFRRTDYPFRLTVAEILAAGLPASSARRLT